MSQISNHVMQKVRLIYWTRRFTSVSAFGVYMCIALFLTLFYLVSIPSIVQNMPPLFEFNHFSDFTLSAITNTQSTVQIVLTLILVSLALVISDIVRNVSRNRPIAYSYSIKK